MNIVLVAFLLILSGIPAFSASLYNPSTTTGGGSGSGLSNASLNGNLGSVTGTVTYLNVDIPDYDPTSGGLNIGSVAGAQSTLDYATATLASGVTDTWYAISVSSNGLVVAAWTRDTSNGRGYVYTGTNGPNSLVKNNVLGERVATDLKVTADGRMIFAAYWTSDNDNPNGGLSVSTNYGATWATLYGGYGGGVDASDDGSVILMTGYSSTYMSTNSGSSWTEVFNSSWWYPSGNGSPGHVAVSGDGNVLMFSSFSTPTGPLRYDISTNRGVSFVNTISAGPEGTIGWGSQYACATRTGNRIYLTCSGNSDNGEGYVYYLEAPNYNTFNNITPKATQFYRGIGCSPDGSGIVALAECSGAYGTGTSKTGTVYVSTNYGATFSSPTNFYDVGTVTTYPRWLGKCAWGHTFDGGYAVRGGSGDGKIYKVVVGSVVTNTLNLLGDVNVLGTLAVNGNSVLTNAWQNPVSATDWTWTSDGTQITLTGYTGPNDVIVPDRLDGLPVTGFGTIFSPDLAGSAITSISGGANVTTIVDMAFFNCAAMTSVSLPNATTIGNNAFFQCSALTSVILPNATTIEGSAFFVCDALTYVSLPNATTIGDGAFFSCTALTSVYFGQNAPAEAADVYLNTPNVTNYITSPTATGWTNSWNGRPVVRLPVYADNFYGSGTGITGLTAAQVGALSNGQQEVDIGLTLTQAATTTRDSGFAGNELVTADFVRGLFEAGTDMYPTTNQVTTPITPTGSVYYASDSPLATATAFTLSITGVNHYVMSILDTNVVLAGETLSGPANVEIWIQSAAGAQTALSVKPELYLVPTQDLASITVPTIGDWDAQPQVITLGTTTNRYTWTITWPDHTIASNSYRIARLKVTTKGVNTTAMKIAAGGTYTSHLSMETPTDTGLGSRGATNATLDGVAQTYDATTRTLTLVNTAAGIAAAGGVTGGTFSVGTSVSNVNGTLYIPTNGLGGGGTGGGGDVYLANANTFTNSTPITFNAANAEQRWTGAGYTNSFYMSSSNFVWTIAGTNYAFP